MLQTETLDFSSLNHDQAQALLRQYQLALTVDEALIIQNALLKRPPTLAECILWSIQGSEHCSYKSTRKYLRRFNTTSPDVILGAKEDAGVVAITQDHAGLRYAIVASHESHNHPSQIVPYEGAATGVGGNVRDVSCMGAEVIAVADSLRFGDPELSQTLWIAEGVVSGVAGYGNPLGIANIAGDVYFNPGYNQNCLVTVVTLGIVREDHIIHSYAPANAQDHVFILVGKPTDNSGFGGASFASATLSADSQTQNKGAVQEPNAFLQRHILKANNALFKQLQERRLLDRVGFKDLGAGGVACASVELAETGGYGAEIDADAIPTPMPHLNPAVLLCSETQERFMWVVPSDLVDFILQHYNETFALPEVSNGARAAVIGKIRTDGRYVVKAKGEEIVNALAHDVTKGIVYDRPISAPTKNLYEPEIVVQDYNQTLLQLLQHENIASRAPIYESYDKQVQGRTHFEAGWADAGVQQPFNDDTYPEEIRKTGLALALDHNPRYNEIDAYWGAVNAVCEAVRNVAAVGATPIAITDCLCYGNPEDPEQMAAFAQGCEGIIAACQAVSLKEHAAHTLPVIAGNVSLYNDSEAGAIPPSPMISCIGKIADVDKAISFDFKRRESFICLVGERKDECGGSVLYQLQNVLGANVPQPDLTTFAHEIHALHTAIDQQLVLAAHDISEGGVAVTVAEMSFKNNIGVDIHVPGDLNETKKLFGETGGFILEVAREKMQLVKEIFVQYNVPIHVIGGTTHHARLRMDGVLDVEVESAKSTWLHGLRTRLN